MKKYSHIEFFRSIAIIAIVVYHLNQNIIPGGFLFVNFFFVLTGYLIVSQCNRHSNVFKRRITQLITHVYPMIICVACFLLFSNVYTFGKIAIDGIFGFGFLSNIWYILSNISYFDAYRFISPFKHLWFVAIIAQYSLFYLILHKYVKKKRLMQLLIVGGIVSILVSFLLYNPENVSRVYYGTDTRISSLFIGSLVALYFENKVISKQTKNLFFIGIVGVLLLPFLVNVNQIFVLYGLFPMYDLLCALVIVYGIHYETKLDISYLNKIGEYSFYIYVWHYPAIVLFTSPFLVGNLEGQQFFIKLVIVLFMSVFGVWVTNIYKKLKYHKSIIGMLIVISCFFNFQMTRFEKMYYKSENAQFPLTIARKINSAYNEVLMVQGRLDTSYQQTKYKRLILFGDSTSINVGEGIIEKFPNAIIDAKIGRHIYDSVDELKAYQVYDDNDTAFFIQLGANDTIRYDDDLKEMFASMSKSDIYVALIGADSASFKNNNEFLINTAKNFKNVTIVDFRLFYQNNPDLIYDDGVHIKEIGGSKAAEFLLKYLKK